MAKNVFRAGENRLRRETTLKDFLNFSLGGPEKYFLPWIRAT